MNEERILQLAEVIRNAPHEEPTEEEFLLNEPTGELTGFNMEHVWCGTVGCIAGWASSLWGWGKTGREALELLPDVANALFLPSSSVVPYLADVTSEQAANALVKVAERDPQTRLEMLKIWEEVLA